MINSLKYLGLGACTLLLTILLSVGRLSVAIAHLSHSVSPETSIAQTLPDSSVEQGRQYYRKERYADAIAAWQHTLSTLAVRGDDLNRAMVLSNLALAYRQLGQWNNANQAIRDSLDILKHFQTLTADELKVLAQALNTQGSLQLAQGQAELALTSWEHATDIYQQAGETSGVTRSLINQATALRVLGFHRRALQQINQAMSQIDEESDPKLRVTLLRSLGEAQRLMGNLEGSNQRLRKSLQLAEQLESPDEEAVTLISLGNTLWAQAQQQETLAERTKQTNLQAKANHLFQEALTKYRQAAQRASSPLIQVQAQLNQLDILIHLQVWSEAQELWAILPKQLDPLPLSRSSINAAIKLAENLIVIRQKTGCREIQCPPEPKIQQILTIAAQQAQALNDPQAQSYALGSLGHLYEQEEKTRTAAIELTEQALNLSQANQSPEISYLWQWQLGRLYNAQRNTKDAIAAYDTAFRAVQGLRQDLLFLSSDIQFTFRDRISPLYRQYVALLLPKDASEMTSNVQAQAVQAEVAREVIDDLRVAELENFLACSLINPNRTDDLVDIDTVANADNRTASLYPIILDDRLEVLLKLPNQPILRYPSLLVSRTTIETTLDQLRKSLEQPYFSSKQGKPAAAQAYEWLIQPAEYQHWLNPTQIDTLVFVLDSKFRNIPMAALFDTSTNQFLIEKYAIAATFGNLHLPKKQPSNQFRALIAGLSDATNEPGFGALTYVPVEILNIEQVLGHPKVLENSGFTKDTIESEIKVFPYNIVHLATHGEFSFSREETYLLAATVKSNSEPILAVEKIDLNQLDTLLRARNQSPIELLVLSACETATGDDREVLGIAGMAIQAGARSTLATLWSIDDSSTAVLMKTFYNSLVNGKLSKAQALRQAQRQLVQDPAYKPSDWAPYLLVGDWR